MCVILPLLSKIFLIYQQLSFPSRSSSRCTLFRTRFMKWYFVRFHFSIRLDLLSRGKAGFRRHLIPKVSRNSYSAGNVSTGCLKSLTFEHKNIFFLNFSQIFYFHSNYAEQNSVVLQFDYFNIILQIYYIRFHLRLFSHFTMHFCDKIKIMSIAF